MAKPQFDPIPFPAPSAVEPAAGGGPAHRCEVVRRLLARGVSPQVLALVLPGWESTIAGALVQDGDAGAGPSRRGLGAQVGA